MAERDQSPHSTSSTLCSIAARMEQEEPVSRSSSTASPPTSTPPTSLGDEVSILSEVSKMEQAVETQEEPSTPLAPTPVQAVPQSAPEAPNSEGRRPTRSSRKSVTTYNVQILAGTAIHTPTKYLEKHHKNVLHGPIETVVKTSPAPTPKKRTPRPKTEPTDISDPAEQQLATEVAQAAQRRTSSRVTDLRREAFRNLAGVGEAVISGGKQLMHNALRRSASDSRLRSSTTSGLSSPRRSRTARGAETEDDADEEEDDTVYVKPKTKQWLVQGLYVGQDRDFDARLSESQNRARRKSRQSKDNKILPLPMFSGERMLSGDPHTSYRDFKLSYDIYNPLPRKVKVDGWVKLHKSKICKSRSHVKLTILQTGSLAMLLLCGSGISRIRRNATVTQRTDAGKPATTASWPTSAITRTARLLLSNARIVPLHSSRSAQRAMATIMVLRSWRLKIRVMVSEP